MNDQQNVQLVQQAYAAFGRNDVDGILATLTDDADWQFYGPAELPMGGLRKGKTEIRTFFKQVADAWNFDQFEPRQFIAQGDTVVVLGSYKGTSKSTKRPFTSEWAHVFTFKNDKITKFREYTDTANLLNAHGATAVKA
jgi:uncharacterized protein